MTIIIGQSLKCKILEVGMINHRVLVLNSLHRGVSLGELPLWDHLLPRLKLLQMSCIIIQATWYVKWRESIQVARSTVYFVTITKFQETNSESETSYLSIYSSPKFKSSGHLIVTILEVNLKLNKLKQIWTYIQGDRHVCNNLRKTSLISLIRKLSLNLKILRSKEGTLMHVNN